MSYDGRAVANFILDFCDASSRPRKITNLSLQKIVYFCHAWSLVRLKKPLVKHKFEAWQYGPVLQYLYREFNIFEADPITSRAMKIDPYTGKKERVGYSFDKDTEEMLQEIVDFYSQIPAAYLVQLSHIEGGPWDKVWNHSGKINPGMQIDDEEIERYYSRVNKPYVKQ